MSTIYKEALLFGWPNTLQANIYNRVANLTLTILGTLTTFLFHIATFLYLIIILKATSVNPYACGIGNFYGISFA